jgi:hypothetical protein
VSAPFKADPYGLIGALIFLARGGDGESLRTNEVLVRTAKACVEGTSALAGAIDTLREIAALPEVLPSMDCKVPTYPIRERAAQALAQLLAS